jgi:hypothetical protein
MRSKLVAAMPPPQWHRGGQSPSTWPLLPKPSNGMIAVVLLSQELSSLTIIEFLFGALCDTMLV